MNTFPKFYLLNHTGFEIFRSWKLHKYICSFMKYLPNIAIEYDTFNDIISGPLADVVIMSYIRDFKNCFPRKSTDEITSVVQEYLSTSQNHIASDNILYFLELMTHGFINMDDDTEIQLTQDARNRIGRKRKEQYRDPAPMEDAVMHLIEINELITMRNIINMKRNLEMMD